MAQTRFKQIEKWNKKRGLLTKYEHKNEVSFIVEELIESSWNIESKKARRYTKLVTWILSVFKPHTTREQKADAYCDMIVFATGALLKLGYVPDIAMDETLKELNARTGTLIDGKFIKDVVENPYKADYSKAEIV